MQQVAMGCLQRWKQVLGLVAVCLTAAIWVGGGFVVQAVSKGNSSKSTSLPSFVTNYITLAMFALYFPVFLGQATASRSSTAGENPAATLQDEPKEWNDGLESKKQKAAGADVVDKEAVAAHSVIGASYCSSICAHCGQEVGQADSSPDGLITSWELFIATGTGDEVDKQPDVDVLPGATVRNFLSALVVPLLEGIAVRKIALSAMMMYPVWFLAYYLFVIALMFTSATSAQVMYTTMSVFSYILSIFMLGEKFVWAKAVSTALCVTGAVFVNLADSLDSKSGGLAVLGNILAMVAAFTYSLYSISFQKFFPQGIEGPAMCLYFSILGGLHCILMLPGVTWYAALGQVTLLGCAAIIGRGIANMAAEYMWATSVLLLGPSLSSIVVVPIMVILGALGDVVLGNAGWLHDTRSITFMAVGMFTIFVGFLGLSFISNSDSGSSTAGDQAVDTDNAKTELRRGLSVAAPSMILPAQFTSGVWLMRKESDAATPECNRGGGSQLATAPSLRLASVATPRLNRSLTTNETQQGGRSLSLRHSSAVMGKRPNSLITSTRTLQCSASNVMRHEVEGSSSNPSQPHRLSNNNKAYEAEACGELSRCSTGVPAVEMTQHKEIPAAPSQVSLAVSAEEDVTVPGV